VASPPHTPNAVSKSVRRAETMAGCGRTSVGKTADFSTRSRAATHQRRPDWHVTPPADMAAPLPLDWNNVEANPIKVKRPADEFSHTRRSLPFRSVPIGRRRPGGTAHPRAGQRSMKSVPGRSRTTRSKRRSSSRARGFSREQRTVLRQAIIDKLQVLALRRPRALIVVERVLDALLDDGLHALEEGRKPSAPVKKSP